MEEMTLSKREKHDAEGTGVLPRAEIVRDEHPLSLGKTSVWNQYFQVTLMNTKITCWWVLHFCIIWFTLECGVWSTIIGIVPYSNCSCWPRLFLPCAYHIQFSCNVNELMVIQLFIYCNLHLVTVPSVIRKLKNNGCEFSISGERSI